MSESRAKELVTLLGRALREPSTRHEAIKRFQQIVWSTPENGSDDENWALFGDLAIDLDYYEPNARLRRQAPQFFGDEELENMLRVALKKLENRDL